MTSAKQNTADDKMRSEIARLVAETSRINSKNHWLLMVLSSGLTLAVLAIAKQFL